jgi:hypothetical protein
MERKLSPPDGSLPKEAPMTLVLELPPDVEARLDAQAAERGVAPADYALQILETNLPLVRETASAPVSSSQDAASSTDAIEDPTISLLRQWREEREAMTPEELAEAEAEWETFRNNINATRAAAGSRLLYP